MNHFVSRPVVLASLLLTVCLSIGGCRAKPATTPATPRDALIQFAEATHAGDEARMLAALEASEKQTEFFRVLSQFFAAVAEFRGAFTKAYGEQAWNDFQDDSKAPHNDGNAKLTVTDPHEKVAQIRNLAIDQRGDEAFCPSMDESGKTVRLIKVKDGWHVDANSVCPKEGEMQKTIGQFRPLVAILRKYMKAIGRPGIKPQDIDAELGREITKLLTGFELPAPHRFEIDKL